MELEHCHRVVGQIRDSSSDAIINLTTGGGARFKSGADDLYVSRGVLASSDAALVEKAVELIQNLGESVATPDEARNILSL